MSRTNTPEVLEERVARAPRMSEREQMRKYGFFVCSLGVLAGGVAAIGAGLCYGAFDQYDPQLAGHIAGEGISTAALGILGIVFYSNSRRD